MTICFFLQFLQPTKRQTYDYFMYDFFFVLVRLYLVEVTSTTKYTWLNNYKLTVDLPTLIDTAEVVYALSFI